MNTNGHYEVNRRPLYGGGEGDIRWLACVHCRFRVDVRSLHRRGDKSGAPRYCRARNRMVRHLHAEHREAMRAAQATAFDADRRAEQSVMAEVLTRTQELLAAQTELVADLMAENRAHDDAGGEPVRARAKQQPA